VTATPADLPTGRVHQPHATPTGPDHRGVPRPRNPRRSRRPQPQKPLRTGWAQSSGCPYASCLINSDCTSWRDVATPTVAARPRCPGQP
jgi:hypothetical protein